MISQNLSTVSCTVTDKTDYTKAKENNGGETEMKKIYWEWIIPKK